MKGVILAAGFAKRLRPLSDIKPKCLFDVGKYNIIHRLINNLIINNITELVMVLGYKSFMIQEYISENFSNKINITYLINSDYENNNNAFSLLMTKDIIEDSDFVLLDSDIVFDHRILGKLLNSGYSDCLALNCHELGEEEIKIKVDNENRILAIGKELLPKECLGESIGIEKFSAKTSKLLFEVLHNRVIEQNYINEFYEASFQELISLNKADIYAVDTTEFPSIEIDFIEDLEVAKNKIIPLIEKNS